MALDPLPDRPRSTAQIFGHPLHPMLVPFPIVCFIGAFVTDIVYWRTANLMWQYFSIWLITAGLVIGGLAALVGLIDYFGDRARADAAARRRRTCCSTSSPCCSSWSTPSSTAATAGPRWCRRGSSCRASSRCCCSASAWLGGSLTYRDGVGVAR